MVSQEYIELARRITGIIGGLLYNLTEYCILATISAIIEVYYLKLILLVFYTLRR